MTNLVRDCRMFEFPQPKGSVFLQEGLIHRTSWGLAVRSKSELLIAEALDKAGVTRVWHPETGAVVREKTRSQTVTFGKRGNYQPATAADASVGHAFHIRQLGKFRCEYGARENAQTEAGAVYSRDGCSRALHERAGCIWRFHRC